MTTIEAFAELERAGAAFLAECRRDALANPAAWLGIWASGAIIMIWDLICQHGIELWCGS